MCVCVCVCVCMRVRPCVDGFQYFILRLKLNICMSIVLNKVRNTNFLCETEEVGIELRNILVSSEPET